MANRLGVETSPYLQQHADNPVDWWPWGPQAFAEAQRLGRPVFVSIGYAACHWCHVMAHESFEDADTAAVMNEQFINIKVDREERPEVDAVYMNAIQVQGEGGGWPLSAFCMPDGRPFFLGTYFAPTPRFGRPSFRDMLRILADAFANKRDQVEDNAAALIEGLGRFDEHYRKGASASLQSPSTLTASTLVASGRQVAERCDPKYGGLRGAPKFPSCSTLEVLARAARQSFGEQAHAAFAQWCSGMVDGGIYDHLGGGWARYAVDEKWLVPHFEKMLYDQAQLLSICASAHSLIPEDPRYPERIVETIGFLQRELSDAAGGLWSSLDADSEGEEGKYYVWTPAQLGAALGKRDTLVFAAAYGVTQVGNFEHGTTVLSRISARDSAYEEEDLARMRQALLAARQHRVRPGTDDKVLASWNGLAISGLLASWRATGYAPALELARRVADFLQREMFRDGALARIWGKGSSRLDGTLEDYAFCALAFLELAEAMLQVTAEGTIDDSIAVPYWQLGRSLVEAIRTRFVEALLRIGIVCDHHESLALAERYLGERLGGDTANAGVTQARLLAALDFYLHHQVVVISEGRGAAQLLAQTRRAAMPTTCPTGSWAAASIRDGKTANQTGQAQAYVCRGATCSAPVSDPAALFALLRS
jgi:uncharacterized protein